MSVTQTLFMQEPGDASAVSINDVNQGWLGDCFVCAPIAALALERPDYIQHMIRDNEDGTQSVRLYLDPSYFNNDLAPHFTVAADNSTWITVHDSDLSPGMNTNNGGQLIVNGVQEIWPQVIENAIAQVYGGYINLNYGGFSDGVMQLLTGAPVTQTYIALQNYGATTQPSTAQLQADLAAKDMVTFFTGAPDGHGLIYNHAYTLTSVNTENGVDYAHFRNPWGYSDPEPIPVSDLGNAFVGMDVGTVPNLTNTAGAPSIVDTTPPVLTAAENVSGLTNISSIVLSGTVADGQSGIARVEVYDMVNKHQVDLGGASVGSDGHWTFTATNLADGTHQFVATATDTVGNTTGQLSAGGAITVDTTSPQPAIKIITGNIDGGVTLAGVSEANSTVMITDSVSGKPSILGTAMASSTGAWQLTSHAKVNTATINTFSATAHDQAGNTGAMPGAVILTSTGADTLTSASGVSDVFAIMSFKGSDVISGFQTAATAGSLHDYIDLSGRGITSFSQVQSMISGTTSTVLAIGSGKTITLTDVAPALLTAADFRYS